MARPRRSRATVALKRKVQKTMPGKPVQDKITVYLDMENVAWLDAQDYGTRSSALNDLIYKARNVYVRSEMDVFFEWLCSQEKRHRYVLGVQDAHGTKMTGSISMSRLVEAFLIETYGRPVDRGAALLDSVETTAPKMVTMPAKQEGDE